MPWVVTFDEYKGSKGSGVVTATYSNDTISFSLRDTVDTNGDFSDFIQRCKAAQAKAESERTELDAIIAKVEAALNS